MPQTVLYIYYSVAAKQLFDPGEVKYWASNTSLYGMLFMLKDDGCFGGRISAHSVYILQILTTSISFNKILDTTELKVL